MRALALIVAALAGCNQVHKIDETDLLPDADLRPDRDRDMIADVDDPCIASEADLASDIDMDGIANGVDICPLAPASADADGDGLHTLCDPFETIPGDRNTCAFAFADAAMSTALWRPRTGERGFAVADGYLTGFAGRAGERVTSVVAEDRIAPASGSITFDLAWVGISDTFTFRIWLSAGAVPGPTDVACEVKSDLAGTVLSAAGASTAAATGVRAAAGSLIRIHGVVQPGKADTNVLCSVLYISTAGATTTLKATGHHEGALGQQGFAVSSGFVVVHAGAIYHRDDQPPLM